MVEAESIAWHKMKEEDFEQLMKRFFELAETRILPGIDRKDVEREAAERQSQRNHMRATSARLQTLRLGSPSLRPVAHEPLRPGWRTYRL